MPTSVNQVAARRSHRPLTTLGSSIIAALACVGMFEASSVCASGFHVSSCADDGGATTLRAVIAGANDGDYVFLDQLPITCSKISLITGAIEIGVPSLTIEGVNGRDIDISAGGASRVFHHTGTSTLVLKYLHVSDGYYKAPIARGGCIYSAGNVTLFANDDVSNCSAISYFVLGDQTSGEAKGARYSRPASSRLILVVCRTAIASERVRTWQCMRWAEICIPRAA